MKSKIFTLFPALALAAVGMSQVKVKADDPVPFAFASEDLILGVQATSGQGSSINLFFNLGKTTDFRDDAIQGELGNIGAEMEETYGANWFSRTNLWFGAIGNRSNLSPTLSPGTGSQDPGSTFYLSRATTVANGATPYPPVVTAALSSGGTNYSGLKRIFTNPSSASEILYATENGAALLVESEHPVAWNNSWSKWNPTPGAAFLVFTGGIQNSFGKPGDAVLIDIQRVVPNTAGTYVTTIAIESDGTIRTVAPTTETPFQTWINGFAAQIPDPADREPDADPDNSGFPNSFEFAFGGNPANPTDNGYVATEVAEVEDEDYVTLTVLVRSGATFTADGSKRVASQDGVDYVVEGSLELMDFDSAVSEITPAIAPGPAPSGYVYKTFRLDASAGLPGKGFLRAGSTMP